MAAREGTDQVGTTGTTEAPEASDVVIDLRDAEPVVDLRDAPADRPTVSSPRVADGPEHREATQRARFVAVVVIAVLNVFDIVTTYVAISLGAHEGNPVVAWAISSPLVAFAKILVCGSLIAGAVLARHWHRRVTLLSLCAAWTVVGVYSIVVLLNTINVVSRI